MISNKNLPCRIKNKSAMQLFAHYLSIPLSDRPPGYTDIAELSIALKISEPTLYRWMVSPIFIRELNRLTAATIGIQTHNVKKVLYEKAMTGDVQAIKEFKTWVAEINDTITINNKVTGTIEHTFDLSTYLAAKRLKE